MALPSPRPETPLDDPEFLVICAMVGSVVAAQILQNDFVRKLLYEQRGPYLDFARCLVIGALAYLLSPKDVGSVACVVPLYLWIHAWGNHSATPRAAAFTLTILLTFRAVYLGGSR
jgi:hypothetical protein